VEGREKVVALGSSPSMLENDTLARGSGPKGERRVLVNDALRISHSAKGHACETEDLDTGEASKHSRELCEEDMVMLDDLPLARAGFARLQSSEDIKESVGSRFLRLRLRHAYAISSLAVCAASSSRRTGRRCRSKRVDSENFARRLVGEVLRVLAAAAAADAATSSLFPC